MQDNETPTEIMFYVGAQVNPDGDLLPDTFCVFHRLTPFDEAIAHVVHKIGHSLIDMGIKEADGVAELQGISTWQDFADIKLDDDVKMKALLGELMTSHMQLLLNCGNAVYNAALTQWLPESEEEPAKTD